MSYKISVFGPIKQLKNLGLIGVVERCDSGIKVTRYFETEGEAKKFLGDLALIFFDHYTITTTLTEIAQFGTLTLEGITAKIEVVE